MLELDGTRYSRRPSVWRFAPTIPETLQAGPPRSGCLVAVGDVDPRSNLTAGDAARLSAGLNPDEARVCPVDVVDRDQQ